MIFLEASNSGNFICSVEKFFFSGEESGWQIGKRGYDWISENVEAASGRGASLSRLPSSYCEPRVPFLYFLRRRAHLVRVLESRRFLHLSLSPGLFMELLPYDGGCQIEIWEGCEGKKISHTNLDPDKSSKNESDHPRNPSFFNTFIYLLYRTTSS